jgi:hypothetical protein
MSSNTIHIKDMLEAISNGGVPGEWNDEKTAFIFPTVISTNARGTRLLWTVTVRLLKGTKYHEIADEYLSQPVEQLPTDFKAEITVEAKQEDGKVRDHVPTYVTTGKNLGKMNATNAITQALRDALGMYNKQSRRSDTAARKETEAERRAEEESLTELEVEDLGHPAPKKAAEFDKHPPPMLVKKIGDSREATLTRANFKQGITVQPKLNGVRNVSFRVEGPTASKATIYMYSRGKKEYLGMNHIRTELLPILAPEVVPKITAGSFGVPERFVKAYEDSPVYLDGEIYKLGKPLQWISGQARKEADEKNLDYYVFDCFFPGPKAAGHDMESGHRQAYLDAIFAAAKAADLATTHLVRVPNRKVTSEAQMDELAKEFVKEGYEGAIARKDWVGYRYSYNGYHSSNVVKIKPKFDDEFAVVGFTEGKGKDLGAVIWVCEVAEEHRKDVNDYEFSVVPNMPLDDRRRLFACLGVKVKGEGGKMLSRFERDIKGLPLTVEYAERSAKTGKPLQPKAITFRTYPEGFEGDDPVKKLYEDCGLVH